MRRRIIVLVAVVVMSLLAFAPAASAHLNTPGLGRNGAPAPGLETANAASAASDAVLSDPGLTGHFKGLDSGTGPP